MMNTRLWIVLISALLGLIARIRGEGEDFQSSEADLSVEKAPHLPAEGDQSSAQPDSPDIDESPMLPAEGDFADFWEDFMDQAAGPPEKGDALRACLEHHPNPRSTVHVSSEQELQNAMNEATPGTMIVLRDGVYRSRLAPTRTFEVKFKNASRSDPITICGTARARLDGDRKHAPLMIYKSSYVQVVGISVTNGAKGIKMYTVKKCLLDSVTVDGTNVEAIHIQFGSHYNTVRNCTVRNTGRTIPKVGEGIYLGSSRRNRRGDVCIGNRILYNTIGPGVTAEAIDVKEWTRGGLIKGNRLDGRDLCSCPDPVSLILVKGSDYRIEDNVGTGALQSAFANSKVATAPPPRGNVFKNNRCTTPSRRRGFPCTKSTPGNKAY